MILPGPGCCRTAPTVGPATCGSPIISKIAPKAVKLCRGCPIFTECGEAASARREQFGVWSGVDRTPRTWQGRSTSQARPASSAGQDVTANLLGGRVLTLDGIDAHQALMMIEWLRRNYPSVRNGGAVPEIPWLPLLRRAAKFVDETTEQTSEVIEASSDIDHEHEINAIEAAKILGWTPTYVRRIRHKIGFVREAPVIMFDRATVEHYKLRPPSRNEAA